MLGRNKKGLEKIRAEARRSHAKLWGGGPWTKTLGVTVRIHGRRKLSENQPTPGTDEKTKKKCGTKWNEPEEQPWGGKRELK